MNVCPGHSAFLPLRAGAPRRPLCRTDGPGRSGGPVPAGPTAPTLRSNGVTSSPEAGEQDRGQPRRRSGQHSADLVREAGHAVGEGADRRADGSQGARGRSVRPRRSTADSDGVEGALQLVDLARATAMRRRPRPRPGPTSTDATASCRRGPRLGDLHVLSAVIGGLSASTEEQTPDASRRRTSWRTSWRPAGRGAGGRAGRGAGRRAAEELAEGLSDEQPTMNAARTRAGSAASERVMDPHCPRPGPRDPSVRVNARAVCAA